jgi:fructooligosaccharide transport system substrate-binding protein
MDDTKGLLRRELTRRQALKAAALGSGGLMGIPSLAAFLAACATGNSPTTTTGPATLRFFRWQSDTMNQEVAAYKLSNPNITINFEEVPFGQMYDKIALFSSSSNPPDIIGYDAAFTKSYAASGILLPLDKWITADQKADMIPSVVGENSYNGKLYSPGFVDSPVLMFYNKDLTDAAGINPPQDLASGWTWDQAKAAFQKVRKGPASNPTVWGLASSMFGDGTPGFWLRDGQVIKSAGDPTASPDSSAYKTFQLISADGKTATGYINTPEAVAALKLYQSLYSENLTPKIGTPNQFLKGQGAFELNTVEFVNVLSGEIGIGGGTASLPVKFKWGVTPLPYVKTPVVFASSVTVGVSAKTKYPDQAGAFLAFASSVDQSIADTKKHGTLPPRVSVLNTFPEFKASPRNLFVNALRQWGQPTPLTTGFSAYSKLLTTALHDIALGADVQTRINQAASQMDQALQLAP